MPSAMPKSNTIEFDSAKRLLLSKELEGNNPNTKQELSFRLGAVLQSSLDLNQVLTTFSREIQKVSQICGLTYTSNSNETEFKTGRKASHSCGYRLITKQDHLGEITFYRSKRFTEDVLELVENSLSALIFPLRNSLQYREALVASLTDPLTGAGNRLALENSLNREIDLAKRHSSSLSLLVIDVDDFKHINDKWGHKTGDQVLKIIVEKLNEVNRQTDLTFRFGGEEFVVLLNETSQAGAGVIAERIRQKIEHTPIELSGNQLHITVSIGAATLKANDNKDRLFKRSDKALYQAKFGGKNQVISL